MGPWGFLIQPPAWSRTSTSSWAHRLWLCPAKPWKPLRMEIPLTSLFTCPKPAPPSWWTNFSQEKKKKKIRVCFLVCFFPRHHPNQFIASLCSQLLTTFPVSGSVFPFYMSRDLTVMRIHKQFILSCHSAGGGMERGLAGVLSHPPLSFESVGAF